MRTSTPVRDIYLSVTGVARKDRKEKNHIVKLGNLPIETTAQDVEAEARAKLSEFKSVSRAMLNLNWAEVEVDDENPGVKIQRFMLMDDRHIRVRLV